MKTEIHELQLTTPTFLAGANQHQAEIRVPSIRGEWRWWFRALGGTRKQEDKIFGNVHGNARRSMVTLRIPSAPNSTKTVDLEDLGWHRAGDPCGYLLWPLRRPPNGDGRHKRAMLEAGTTFTLQVAAPLTNQKHPQHDQPRRPQSGGPEEPRQHHRGHHHRSAPTLPPTNPSTVRPLNMAKTQTV